MRRICLQPTVKISLRKRNFDLFCLLACCQQCFATRCPFLVFEASTSPLCSLMPARTIGRSKQSYRRVRKALQEEHHQQCAGRSREQWQDPSTSLWQDKDLSCGPEQVLCSLSGRAQAGVYARTWSSPTGLHLFLCTKTNLANQDNLGFPRPARKNLSRFVRQFWNAMVLILSLVFHALSCKKGHAVPCLLRTRACTVIVTSLKEVK